MQRQRTIPLLLFQLALLSLFCLALTRSGLAGEINTTDSAVSGRKPLTDADSKSIIRDYIETDKIGVGRADGIVDEHNTQVVCCGKLDNGTDADVNGDTLFEIGSVTKVFTALLLQDMVDRGEMKLDDPVQKYLPGSVKMPMYHGKQITLLDLATHTSGLPRDPGNVSPRSWRNPGAGYTVEQFYDFLNHCRLQHEPGTHREYSNLGVALLGHVIALKAGTNYESLVVNRICDPLGMDSTHVTLTPELRSRLAVGHALPGYRVAEADFSFLPGGGSLHSSVNDLLKFVSAYSGLTPSALAPLMQRAEAFHTMADGTRRRLVWPEDSLGPTVFWHNGRTFGYTSCLAFDVKTQRGIVVLSNCGSTLEYVDGIYGPLMAGISPKPTNALPTETMSYDRYTGQYRLGQPSKDSGILVIRRERDRLIGQWWNHARGLRYPGYEVFPISNRVFANKFWEVQATFSETTNTLVLTSLGPYSGFKDPITMTKISTNIPGAPLLVHPDPQTYDTYAGRYRMSFLFGLLHLGPSFNIRHETDELGDHLVGYITGKHLDTQLPGLAGNGIYGCEIFPKSKTVFFNPLEDSLRITFNRNKTGKAKDAVIELNGSTIRVTRVSDKPAN
jgi:CubicO group peptidase (beta-lactamase class C family)